MVDFIFSEMEPLRNQVDAMAAHLRGIAKSGRDIVVKYDGDADGLSGALIIYRMFKALGTEARFQQGEAPVYSTGDALKDIMHYGSAHYLFIDYANNNDSVEGLALLRKNALSIAIIDHHISTRKPEGEIVLTPVWHGLDYSYTSGYLCYEVARRVADIDYGNLWKVSLHMDKSMLGFERDKDTEKIGLVLDYLTATMKKERHSVRFIDGLIRDKEMLYAVYFTAKEKIDEATALALKICKKKELENGFTVVTINADKVVEQGEFPQRGKVAGKVHDAMLTDPSARVVTIGYSSDSAMLRASAGARAAGFNANAIVEQAKKEYPGIIVSGGGHPGAAAIRFRKGFKATVIQMIIDKISALPK